MRTTKPNPLVRFRHLLLGLALLGWAVAGVVIVFFKDTQVIPVQRVVAVSALVFIWANGAYWWVMHRYPYIELPGGQFASRDEWQGKNHGLLLLGYLVAALFASVACFNLVVNG